MATDMNRELLEQERLIDLAVAATYGGRWAWGPGDGEVVVNHGPGPDGNPPTCLRHATSLPLSLLFALARDKFSALAD